MYKKYNQKTLEKLREVELEILDEVVRICEEHKIEYFLTGGTLLGAVRHKGFIPWDDDIDIGMTRKNYDLFIEKARKELKSSYYLDCYETNINFYLPFAKIKKNGTIFDEKPTHHIKNHKGIYIDIIPFENADNKYSIKQRIQAVLAKATIEAIFVKNKIRELKKTRNSFIVAPLLILSTKKLIKLQQKLFRLNKNDNSLYVVPLAGTYSAMLETIKRSVLSPTKKILFCNKKYNCMNDNDAYLSNLFGDYMQLPPEEKRVNHMPLKISFNDKKGSNT